MANRILKSRVIEESPKYTAYLLALLQCYSIVNELSAIHFEAYLLEPDIRQLLPIFNLFRVEHAVLSKQLLYLSHQRLCLFSVQRFPQLILE